MGSEGFMGSVKYRGLIRWSKFNKVKEQWLLKKEDTIPSIKSSNAESTALVSLLAGLFTESVV